MMEERSCHPRQQQDAGGDQPGQQDAKAAMTNHERVQTPKQDNEVPKTASTMPDNDIIDSSSPQHQSRLAQLADGDSGGSSSSDSHTISTTARSVAGSWSVKLSDAINSNIVTARYATLATIGLLSIYGIAHTPLFFRYRTVSEIPSRYFGSYRKTITCRLVRTAEATPARGGTDTAGPIRLEMRHLSPIERILPLSWYDWIMKVHPASSALGKRPDLSPEEMLKVELVGIQMPPHNYHPQPWQQEQRVGDWLNDFASRRPIVKCQLLARRVVSTKEGDESSISSQQSPSYKISGKTTKRKIPGFEENLPSSTTSGSDSPVVPLGGSTSQIALCKVYYKSTPYQLFSTDLAELMVSSGRASPLSDGLYLHASSSTDAYGSEKIVDAATMVDVLRKDAKYLDRLAEAEYEAARNSHGMWADPEIRKLRSDVVEEVEFRTKAPLWQKLWRRWIRGG